jgi:hypothetical protein
MQAAVPASHVLGRKLDSIPFSLYHLMIILVLGTVGFVEGYDLALGGSLLVLASGLTLCRPSASSSPASPTAYAGSSYPAVEAPPARA